MYLEKMHGHIYQCWRARSWDPGFLEGAGAGKTLKNNCPEPGLV